MQSPSLNSRFISRRKQSFSTFHRPSTFFYLPSLSFLSALHFLLSSLREKRGEESLEEERAQLLSTSVEFGSRRLTSSMILLGRSLLFIFFAFGRCSLAGLGIKCTCLFRGCFSASFFANWAFLTKDIREKTLGK